MSASDANPNAIPGGDRFATTHWSLIVAAQDRDAPEAGAALAELCRAYWYPLYAFIRREGHGADDAQDLTQEFFARLLTQDYLADVDRAKGKFRSFLLAACRHFLSNERDRARTLKRGGGRPVLSLDFQNAEQRYTREPSHDLTADKLFERRWALALLDQVLVRLRAEFTRSDKAVIFDRLKGFLMGRKDAGRYRQIGEELGMSEGAVKVKVHRLRQRYRELLQEEIARTVDDPGQVEEEIRDLFAALGT